MKSSSPPLDKKQTKIIQVIVGTLLYYACGIGPIMLSALNEISTEQAAPSLDAERKAKLLMDYVYTHSNITILQDLVLSEVKILVVGHFFLSDEVVEITPTEPKTNVPVEILSKTIKNIMSSAAEAELGVLYMNAREGVPIR